MITHLVDVSVRSFTLALFAGAVLWAFRKRASAAMAHAVWSAVLCGMLLLFALGSVIPPLSLRIAPPAAAAQSATIMLKRLDFGLARTARAGMRTQPALVFARPSRRSDLRDMASAIYLGTAFFLAGRLLTGWFLIRRLVARSTAIGFPDVYESAGVAVPVTVGWINPKILLPNVWRDWDSAKLDAILAHERAHIRRHDSLVLNLARLNRCVFWFHPLAWWLGGKLALLAEQASDEAFIAAGGDRPGYARLLLEMAVAVENAHGRVYHQALGMASRIGQRIDRVLDENICLSPNMTPARWLLLAGTTAPLIYGAAAVQIEQQRALSRSEFPRLSAPTAPKLIAQQRPARSVPPPALTPVADQAVVINVEVFEPLGRYVTGLEGANFRVFEDDVEQTITGFSSALTPISLGVVVNVHSGALQNPQQTNVEFSRELLPEDELFVSYPVGPGLPLFNAVYNAMTQLERARNQRKILYVVSDQADLASRYTAAELSQALKDSVVQVFAAVSTDQPDGATLREIAEATGGSYFVGFFSPDGRFLAELNDGKRELGSLGSIFRMGGLGAVRAGSYALTYTPTNPARDGGFRRIRVGVTGVGLPPLTARTRSGYFAPTR